MIPTPCLLRPLYLAAFLGLVHFLVDAASLTILYREVGLGRLDRKAIEGWIDLYNALAFGLQVPLALFVDRRGEYRWALLVGLECVLLALVVSMDFPPVAIILVGLGNALFHLGAGALVLRSSTGTATAAGVFVAPGALGVAIGIRLGGSDPRACGWLIGALLFCGAILVLHYWPILRRGLSFNLFQDGPRRSPDPVPGNEEPKTLRFFWLLGALLLLISVSMRSLVAGSLSTFAPETVDSAFFLLPLAAAVGKALGGGAADRLGWRKTAVVVLLVLAGLIDWARFDESLCLVSMFLIQATMAVTLAGLFVALPGRPATAFGLTSLALLLGSSLRTADFYGNLGSSLGPVVFLSVLTVFFGLTLVPRGNRCPRQ